MYFIQTLANVNLTSAKTIDSQQAELFQAYEAFNTSYRTSERLTGENRLLQEQVKDKDEEIARLKSFIRHFKAVSSVSFFLPSLVSSYS